MIGSEPPSAGQVAPTPPARTPAAPGCLLGGLRWLGRIVAAFILLLLLAVAYLWVRENQPAVLPKPSGPYSVGRTEFDWVESQRTDPFSAQPNQPRARRLGLAPGGRPARKPQGDTCRPPGWKRFRRTTEH